MNRNPGWLRSNLVSLVLALVLALTVWIVASLEENPPETRDLNAPIPIDVVNLAPGLVITNDYTTQTHVQLRAQKETWNGLSSEDLVAVADLSGLGPGEHQVHLNITVDEQAELVSANPGQIRIELEEVREREIPVQVEVEGAPPLGYKPAPAEVSPAMATIRGPQSRVDLISEVRAAVSIEGLDASFSDDVTLVALDSSEHQVDGVTITPATASVSVLIEQEAGYRVISINPQITGRVAPGYYVSGFFVSPQRVTVQGDPGVLEGMLPYAETQPIDITDLTDDVRRRVSLELPDGVVPETDTVEVLISIAAQQGNRTVIDVPLQVISLGSGLAAEISPQEVDIYLTGPVVMLDSIDPLHDITVTVDLSGLDPGVYQIEPDGHIDVDTPPGQDIVIETILPIVIEVTIT